MTITTEAFLTLLGGAMSGLAGWIFILHGRISGHERGCTERQKTLDERHGHIEQALAKIDQKLERLVSTP